VVDWEDINLDIELWRCPSEKMKVRERQKRDSRTPAHIVPLPRQALEILRELYPLAGPTGPIFRSMSRRSEKSRYISDNTIVRCWLAGVLASVVLAVLPLLNESATIGKPHLESDDRLVFDLVITVTMR